MFAAFTNGSSERSSHMLLKSKECVCALDNNASALWHPLGVPWETSDPESSPLTMHAGVDSLGLSCTWGRHWRAKFVINYAVEVALHLYWVGDSVNRILSNPALLLSTALVLSA